MSFSSNAAIFDRRKKILTRATTPTISYAQQQGASLEAKASLALQVHHKVNHELQEHISASRDKEMFFTKEDFTAGVHQGDIEVPPAIKEKFPGYFDSIQLIIGESKPLVDKKEEVYWVEHKPDHIRLKSGDYKYTLWHKKPNSDEFKQIDDNVNMGAKDLVAWRELSDLIDKFYRRRFFRASSAPELKEYCCKLTPMVVSRLKKGFSENIIEEVTDFLGRLWDDWLGNIKIPTSLKYQLIYQSYKSSAAKKLSSRALQKLLAQYGQTQPELDLYHLPQGFVLYDKNLDYLDKIDTTSSAPYKIEAVFSTEKEHKSESKETLDSALLPEEEKIWKFLFEEHKQHNEFYREQDLLRTYHEFLRYLADHHLKLPTIPFSSICQIKSLPTALGHIISLLENSAPEDQQRQLDLVPLLNLSNRGAIRAIYAAAISGHKRCRFVHPAMRCSEEYFHEYGYAVTFSQTKDYYREVDFAYPHIASNYKRRFGSICHDTTQEAFWRYVAHHEGMSLSFYEKASEIIETKFHGEHQAAIKACLYTLLAGLTTNVRFKNKTEDDILKQWSKICNLIGIFCQKYISDPNRPDLLKKFCTLRKLPPLELFEKMLERFNSLDEKQIKEETFSLQDLIRIFEDIYKIDASIIYKAMHCSDQKDEESYSEDFSDSKKTLAMSLIKRITNLTFFDMSHFNQKFLLANTVYLIVPLAHIVALDHEAIVAIDDIIRTHTDIGKDVKFTKFQKKCIRVLHAIKKDTALEVTALHDILNNIKTCYDTYQNPVQSIQFIEYLEKNYGQMFPDEYLKNIKSSYQANRLSKDLLAYIDQKIPRAQRHTFKKLLFFYREKNTSNQKDLVDLLGKLSSLFTTQGSDFADCLERIIEYLSNGHDDEALSQLNYLLSATFEHTQVAILETIFYRPDMEKTIGLIEKAFIFCEKILPLINERYSQELTHGPLLNIFLKLPLEDPSPLNPIDMKEYKSKETKNHSDYVLAYFENIDKIIKKRPKLKKELLNFIEYFVETAGPDNLKNKELEKQISLLMASAEIVTEEMFRGLLYQGTQMKQPQDLIKYLMIIDQFPKDEGKKTLCRLLAELLGENYPGPDKKTNLPFITLSAFDKLCRLLATKPDLQEIILGHYERPPYMDLQSVVDLFNDYNSTTSNINAFQYHLSYQAEHFVERTADNHFDLAEASLQVKNFSRHNHLTDLETLNDRIKHYKKMSMREKEQCLNLLKEELKTINATNKNRLIIELTALLSEILFSTTTHALNTTQILSVYSQLLLEGNVTHQMSTGSGKSRVAMTVCAGKTLLGKNIDFATENMPLATRDYYKYKKFFATLGIDTLLIDVNSSIDDYLDEKPKICFSSKHQLGLFHDNLLMQGPQHFSKENRVLVADEADTFYADVEKLHLNLARYRESKTDDFRWTWPLVYKFINDDAFTEDYLDQKEENINQKNPQLFYKKLRDYLEKNAPRPDKRCEVKSIADTTLEAWGRAAIAARSLKKDIYFDAESGQDKSIMTPTGIRAASKALVIVDNVTADQSIFAEDVQQFLHVRLNLERQQKRILGKKNISKTPYFFAPPEDIVFTSTTSTLLSHYSQFVGLTGSSGTPRQRAEMAKRLQMTFIDVPDHRPNHRKRLMTHVVATNTQKSKVLQKYDDELMAANRAHLLFSKNNHTSKQLEQALAEKRQSTESLQRIGASLEDYQDKLQKIGKPKTTTVATGAMARGTDVLTECAEGLAVTLDHLPSASDEIQMFGRTARYRMKGTARVVISVEDLQNELSVTPEELQGLYYNRDHFLKSLQMDLDQKDQRARCLNVLINQFYDQFFTHFFNQEWKGENANKIKNHDWPQFIKELYSSVRSPLTDHLNGLLEEKTLDLKQISSSVESLFLQTTKQYNDFLTIHKLSVDFKPNRPTEAVIQEQLTFQKIELFEWQKTYDEYDPAHAGQNVIYTKLFAETRWAWRQWRQNNGSFLEVLWSTQHQKAAADNTNALASPTWNAIKARKRGLLANVRASWFYGNVNQEWEAFEAAYLSLTVAAKNDTTIQARITSIKARAAGAHYRNEIRALTNELVAEQQKLDPQVGPSIS